MRSKTHDRISRKLFPNVDPKVIDEINRIIDSPHPEPWMPPYSSSLGPAPRWRAGHRKYAHDLGTSGIIGFRSAGFLGISLAWLHIGLDAAKDEAVRRWGLEVAELIEDTLNLGLSALEEKQKRDKMKVTRGPRKLANKR